MTCICSRQQLGCLFCDSMTKQERAFFELSKQDYPKGQGGTV